ncbi:TonB-dependent receptor [Fulvimonas sp. R45]|uniref:TonB-dependent receptor domain-containing protein n=1 Tax=Fulvimonas sp. R45 TaxID=3045937 RepID=UPI00265EAFA7|nr:TonB-dependent receptor [Fulvimonas sp. R45]MDO1528958.1 TonB-dependent receptor [Fulvimonas sp. R45]
MRASGVRRGVRSCSGCQRALLAVVIGMAIGGPAAMAQSASAAVAAVTPFHIAPGPLGEALHQFNAQSGLQVLFDPSLVAGKKSPGLDARLSARAALEALLKGTGLIYQFTDGHTVVVKRAARPAAAAANGADAGKPVQLATVNVTAEKKTENIQVVPIAISAFTGQQLDNQKIETGGDLVKVTPNVTFSKTNFASYNFQIRGIGTQALSVTTDPAVAVSFNDTPLLRNRLFEQEYFDVNNVEVLRGPQGTLFGRNATAGVVNMIPNLPNPDGFESWVKAETGNYDTRRFSGMLNVPLSSTLAFRLAGAWTDRDGYMRNTVTHKDVDGRNLWSGRASMLWKPSDRFTASLIWEHFGEHDDRARTGKQLCHTDPGPSSVGGVAVANPRTRGSLSTGCMDGSLYGSGAFGVPNGYALPQVIAGNSPAAVGILPDFSAVVPLVMGNPYAGVTQSTNLRTIATTFDPIFHAKNDVVQLNLHGEVSPSLKLVSQTLFDRDSYFSEQDYNRFPSVPIFGNSTGLLDFFGNPTNPGVTPGGVFVDPQLGASSGMLSVDRSQSWSRQWSQEFRLQSDFDGPFNFNVGVNFLDFHIDENYYVFNNVFTALAEDTFNLSTPDIIAFPGNNPQPCAPGATYGCVYIDPNALGSINGQGHNYFRSDNIARTLSTAVFGEGYWQLADDLKLTVGLRITRDRKTTTPIPSQLLLSPLTDSSNLTPIQVGYVNSGYPAQPNINQRWTEPTGRVVLSWTPRLPFTDSTLLYASYSRGYVAGGTNSPGIDINPALMSYTPNPSTFKPEFVNAFELGTKNVLAGGKLSLNADVFYYDYRNYQVSQISNRGTLNENFDAKVWGAELQAAWQPTNYFRLDGSVGLLGTRIGGRQYSIDPMNLTDGDPNWIAVQPFIEAAQSCIAPVAAVAKIVQYVDSIGGGAGTYLAGLCTQTSPLIQGGYLPGSPYSGYTGVVYDPATAPNGGRGISTNVGGNDLPNAPHYTYDIGAQYTFFLGASDLVLRGDFYRQGPSWARVYNDPIDRLRGWSNANLSLTWEHPDNDLTVQLYAKNLFDKTPITGAFLNSSDSGLTTNVFTLDPRIIGLSIRKGFY